MDVRSRQLPLPFLFSHLVDLIPRAIAADPNSASIARTSRTLDARLEASHSLTLIAMFLVKGKAPHAMPTSTKSCD